MNLQSLRLVCLGLLLGLLTAGAAAAGNGAKTVRVFIFAGQSNMVGSHSKAGDIEQFPPFAGLDEPQPKVRFHYCLGRETMKMSDGWVEMAPVDRVLGPEVSFARTVDAALGDSIAVIKVASGGTTLGADWNPDEPAGFKLYPIAIQRVQEALAALKRKGVKYRIEGVMWHQGENDMFEDEFKAAYGDNLTNFIASWRRDLSLPELPFYIGGHCTKSVWGMDNRMNMHAIDRHQVAVAEADENVTFVPISHVGVELGNETGLHYHYGTLGQLEHGEAYAEAYLGRIGELEPRERPLKRWPFEGGSKVTLVVMAGHRNMEGERAFLGDLKSVRGGKKLKKDNASIPYRYSVGGGFRESKDWEPLGPAGPYDTFGPELSFAAELGRKVKGNVAVAKFTHSGSQLVDWTPEGSDAASRNLFPAFVEFVQGAVASLEAKGHTVEIGAVLYHFGENDTAWHSHRKQSAGWLRDLVAGTREGLGAPELHWVVSQQEPARGEGVDRIDVVAEVAAVAEADAHMTHVPVLELPGDNHPLLLRTEGVVALGRELAKAYLGLKR